MQTNTIFKQKKTILKATNKQTHIIQKTQYKTKTQYNKHNTKTQYYLRNTTKTQYDNHILKNTILNTQY